MKHAVHFLLLMVFGGTVIGTAAQSFQPFTANSKKAYIAVTDPGRGYSLAFDSITLAGTDTVYQHFGQLNDTSTYINPDCIGWGSPYCLRADRPDWAGSLFRTNGAGTYWLRNIIGDTLRLDLAIAQNDTSVFYEENAVRFAITYEGADTLTVFGITDSVSTYRIIHSDTAGTSISSAIHLQTLTVGKQLGMVRFFQIDSFPEVLRPLEMIGNKTPNVGLHRITSGMLYDHQPGDEIQRHSYSSQYGGPPWMNFSTYHKTTYLGRMDSPDSIIYSVLYESFDAGSDSLLTSTTTLEYHGDTDIANIPFDRFSNAHYHRLSRLEFCGIPLWSYRSIKAQGLALCPSEDCWSHYDTQGPDTHVDLEMVTGLGIHRSSTSLTIPPPVGYNAGSRIIYVKKNGITCGNEQIVGVPDRPSPKETSLFFPNPTQGLIHFREGDSVAHLDVFDATGAEMLRIPVLDGSADLGQLAPGVYFLRIHFITGELANVRLLRSL